MSDAKLVGSPQFFQTLQRYQAPNEAPWQVRSGALARVQIELDKKTHTVEVHGHSKTPEAELKARALQRLVENEVPGAKEALDRLKAARTSAPVRGAGTAGTLRALGPVGMAVGAIADAFTYSKDAKDPAAIHARALAVDRGEVPLEMYVPHPELFKKVQEELMRIRCADGREMACPT
ncbi:MAG: hypothetical protein IT384_03825 [Deltaproteobacteria bacterium]|nr:hypothetical protein [Deltaproteobacteria bacterium]